MSKDHRPHNGGAFASDFRSSTHDAIDAADPSTERPSAGAVSKKRSKASATGAGATGVAGPPGANGAAPAGAPVAAATPSPVVAPTHVIGERSAAYRAKFHPDATDAEWNDWKWQLRHRVRDLEGLERVFELTEDERETVRKLGDRLPVGITPYYAAQCDPKDPRDPIRLTMVPLSGELEQGRGEEDDPLGEDGHMVVPGLVHRYPDRVLFLVSTFCATYCRYCTRARMVGKTGEYHFNTAQYERALEYIAATPTIRDVLISGGDPLTMSDERLDWLLTRLRAIEHVEFVRIGSKVPAVLPQRITPELVNMLKKHHPFWLSIHFMHANEVTPEVREACGRLADAGIPLGSQTVLVQGVNDNVPAMKALVHNLLKTRVRPYYLYQCDPISGSAHLRTPIEKGIELIEGLRGHTTGYAVPTFVVDAPGGGGKLPIGPNYLVGREGDDVLLRNFEGNTYRYPDPVSKIVTITAEAPPESIRI
jgi:lysine 2,3-aminomutase